MRRGTLLIVLACLAILGAGGLIYTIAFRDDGDRQAVALPTTTEEKPASPVVPAAPPPVFFDVAEVSGSVEVRRAGAWVPVARGERISPQEAVRTGETGRAVVRAPSGDELTLRERVELEVGLLSDTVTELTLTRGRVRAAAAPGTERIRISSAGTEAVAKGGSRFTVFADPRGAVAVASEAGDVKVIARGAGVTVGSGTQTYVPPGGTPGAPVAIPTEVFLSVAWPAKETHAPRTTVRGRTEPGTEVLVNGTPVAVESDGRFEAELPLREGKNKIRVSAESVGGGVRDAEGAVRVDSRGPPLEVGAPDYGNAPAPPRPR